MSLCYAISINAYAVWNIFGIDRARCGSSGHEATSRTSSLAMWIRFHMAITVMGVAFWDAKPPTSSKPAWLSLLSFRSLSTFGIDHIDDTMLTLRRFIALRSTFKAAIAAAFLFFFASASAALAAPNLWLVKSPTATIYLFGTVHILPPHLNWESPAIKEALAKSQELWFEVPNFEDAGAAAKLVAQLGFDPEHPLSSVLPAKDLARLKKAATTIGLPHGQMVLELMRPWLAALTLTVGETLHEGYDVNSGVEHILLAHWRGSHKPVRGFETLSQQMHLFADMPQRLQKKFLESTLSDIDKGTKEVNAIVTAWLKGDQKTLTRLFVDQSRKPFPNLYRTLIVDRNKRWAKRIEGMLKQHKIRFIAVGAGHLTGPDSVQAKLAAKGIQVELVQ